MAERGTAKAGTARTPRTSRTSRTGRTATAGRGTSAGRRREAAPRQSPPPPALDHPICSVAFCPICLLVTAIGDSRPELTDHLLVAGRELLLAARAVIDARLQSMEQAQAPTGLERIDVE